MAKKFRSRSHRVAAAVQEVLESRRLLTAAVSLEGVLEVNGTAGNDTIAISASGTDKVAVNINGVVMIFKNVEYVDLAISAGGGNDKVTITNAITRGATIFG